MKLVATNTIDGGYSCGSTDVIWCLEYESKDKLVLDLLVDFKKWQEDYKKAEEMEKAAGRWCQTDETYKKLYEKREKAFRALSDHRSLESPKKVTLQFQQKITDLMAKYWEAEKELREYKFKNEPRPDFLNQFGVRTYDTMSYEFGYYEQELPTVYTLEEWFDLKRNNDIR